MKRPATLFSATSLAGAIGLGALFVTAGAAFAEPAPAASATPVASPAPTPNVIGASLGANDPCTSLMAIVTRPSVSNSVCTVRPNKVLVETGYQNLSLVGGLGNTVNYPQTLVRLGLKVPGLELDFAPPQYQRVTGGGTAITGNTDASYGLKYIVGASPKMSYGLQANFTVPIGSDAFTANGTNVYAALNGSLTLSPAFSLGAVLAGNSLTNGTQRYTSIVPSVILTYTLPIAQPTSLFVENAQFTHANGAGTPTRTQILGGVSTDVGSRVQLDASYAFSPTNATGKYHYVGFGASFYLF